MHRGTRIYSLRDFVPFVDVQTVDSHLIGGILTSKVSCNRGVEGTIQYDDFKGPWCTPHLVSTAYDLVLPVVMVDI